MADLAVTSMGLAAKAEVLPIEIRRADLLKLVKILVIKRPATPPSDFEEISIKALDISSTKVRKSISNRENVSNLLPPKVVTFIREYGLYGSR